MTEARVRQPCAVTQPNRKGVRHEALAKWLFGGGGGGGSTGDDRALAILRERYARGEIDKTEFEARKRDLGG